MSLDAVDLELLKRSGTPKARRAPSPPPFFAALPPDPARAPLVSSPLRPPIQPGIRNSKFIPAQEQSYARRIMPVVRDQHWLLVTLLFCNAASTEALPIFLSRLLHPVAAVALGVVSVLVFGEIVPQAVCSKCVFP